MAFHFISLPCVPRGVRIRESFRQITCLNFLEFSTQTQVWPDALREFFAKFSIVYLVLVALISLIFEVFGLSTF